MSQTSLTGLIVNPMARGGASRLDLEVIENLRRDLTADIAFTDPVSGAMECLPNLHEYQSLWIAGGDGTLSQVVNRLANSKMKTMPVIHLLPTGTGNDFAYALGITGTVSELGLRLRKGRIKEVDCGMVVWRDEGDSEERNHAFINAVGIGLDAAVALRAEKLKRTMGRSSYHLAALLALARRKAIEARIVIDGSSLSRRVLLLTICNGPRAGAGFHLTPDAKVDDGLLDLCLLEDVSVARALWLLPKVKRGRHRGFSEARLEQLREANIFLGAPSPMHIDGEVVSHQVLEASVTLAHRRIAFAVPV